MGHLGALGGLPGPSWKPSCACRTPWRAPGRRLATPEALGRGGGARAWMPPEGGPSRMTETLADSTRHSTATQRARGHGGVPAGDANGVCLRARSCPRSTFHQTSRSNGECSCDFLGFFRFGDTSSPEVAPLLIDLCGCGCAERRAFSLWAAPWPRQVRKTRQVGTPSLGILPFLRFLATAAATVTRKRRCCYAGTAMVGTPWFRVKNNLAKSNLGNRGVR